ncbi:PP2C family protein-serine/threonine phosphatase [Candidatus Sumerlaeota bacterium]|nr:PP2C family protein-serine/threonine phosphatase [Candidatus Sumerlaeota bacterium]
MDCHEEKTDRSEAMPLDSGMTEIGSEFPAHLMRLAREHYIYLEDGNHLGRHIRIGTTPIVIGRLDECDVTLVDSLVSKRHCSICREEGTVKIIDLNSTNGVFIDGERVAGSAEWPVNASLQIGHQWLRHEFLAPTELQKGADVASDMRRAVHYVQSLLPDPLDELEIKTDWCFVPSYALGGDSFGYHRLDENHLAFYLLDVSGHGVSSAMHSVSVLNMLRLETLQRADFHDPAAVLGELNRHFGMQDHNQLYFTIWYGVYRFDTRTLDFASGGHPPGLLLSAAGDSVEQLTSDGMAIGFMKEFQYQSRSIELAPDARIYLYSDGVTEAVVGDNKAMLQVEGLEELVRAGDSTGAIRGEAERLLHAIRQRTLKPEFEDDFSILVLQFP